MTEIFVKGLEISGEFLPEDEFKLSFDTKGGGGGQGGWAAIPAIGAGVQSTISQLWGHGMKMSTMQKVHGKFLQGFLERKVFHSLNTIDSP